MQRTTSPVTLVLIVLITLLGELLYPPYAIASSDDRQDIPVLAGNPPHIMLPPQTPLSKFEGYEIKRYIAQLAEIDNLQFGYLPRHEVMDFGPLTGSIPGSLAFSQLVKLGPKALPFLLDALDNQTPTHLTISRGRPPLEFSEGVDRNPANPTEFQVLPARMGTPFEVTGESTDSYTMKVGDICFEILGQIVGRDYWAYISRGRDYTHLVCPAHDAHLVKMLRAIWGSKDPTQHLFDMLLFDYSTRGVYNGHSLDGWDEGSRLQVEATVRLLYYFPQQSAQIIAERLRHLQVQRVGPGGDEPSNNAEQEEGIRREVANGVRTDDFLTAVAWCQAPSIRAELYGIFRRTEDRDLLAILIRSFDVKEISSLFASNDQSLGDDYRALTILGRSFRDQARPIFQIYRQHHTNPRDCQTICHVLQATRTQWDIEFLSPLLTDTRTVTEWVDPSAPEKHPPTKLVRICDEAAFTISSHHPDLPFSKEGTSTMRDLQIKEMRQKITQQR